MSLFITSDSTEVVCELEAHFLKISHFLHVLYSTSLLQDYTGTYVLELIPCTVHSTQKFTSNQSPIPCTANPPQRYGDVYLPFVITLLQWYDIHVKCLLIALFKKFEINDYQASKAKHVPDISECNALGLSILFALYNFNLQINHQMILKNSGQRLTSIDNSVQHTKTSVLIWLNLCLFLCVKIWGPYSLPAVQPSCSFGVLSRHIFPSDQQWKVLPHGHSWWAAEGGNELWWSIWTRYLNS